MPVEDEVHAIVRFVSRMVEAIESRVGLKVKKFNAEVEKLQHTTKAKSIKSVPLSSLKAGSNQGAVLVCRIMAIHGISSDPVPVSFVVADQDGTLMALSIYHVNAEVYHVMKVNAVVMISNPVLRRISIERGAKSLGYDSLCVENPADVVVDGRRLLPQETQLVVKHT